MKKFNCNGYIIQKISDKNIYNYEGVDGDNWYLNYYSNDLYFEDFYNKNISKSGNNIEYVDCCVDELYIKKYINESKKLGIKFKILLCFTDRNYPLISEFKLGKFEKYLGYDYAYSGGSYYYSCILNDIISKRIKEFENIKLNENGLFDSYEEINSFISYREELILKKKYDFEFGDFIIYKIKQVII